MVLCTSGYNLAWNMTLFDVADIGMKSFFTLCLLSIIKYRYNFKNQTESVRKLKSMQQFVLTKDLIPIF